MQPELSADIDSFLLLKVPRSDKEFVFTEKRKRRYVQIYYLYYILYFV